MSAIAHVSVTPISFDREGWTIYVSYQTVGQQAIVVSYLYEDNGNPVDDGENAEEHAELLISEYLTRDCNFRTFTITDDACQNGNVKPVSSEEPTFDWNNAPIVVKARQSGELADEQYDQDGTGYVYEISYSTTMNGAIAVITEYSFESNDQVDRDVEQFVIDRVKEASGLLMVIVLDNANIWER